MPRSAVGVKRCAVSSSTSRATACASDSPGSRWPAGWLSTRRPLAISSTKRNFPSRSITAATVTLGRQRLKRPPPPRGVSWLRCSCGARRALPSGSRRLARVLADELGHARDALLDRRLRRRVGKTHVLAFARHARAEMDVGEHCDAGLVQEALAELLGIRCANPLAGLRDVRPGIEGAARVAAGHAWHLVQEADDQIAPLEEARAHHRRGV